MIAVAPLKSLPILSAWRPDRAPARAPPAGSPPGTLPEIPERVAAKPLHGRQPRRNHHAKAARSTPCAAPTFHSGQSPAATAIAAPAWLLASSFPLSSAFAPQPLP